MLINNHEIGAFLKHCQPSLVLEKFNSTNPNAYEHLRMARIASGEITTRTVWEEHYYEGENSPSEIVAWLSQFDDSWYVDADTEASGREWYVSRSTEIFLDEWEIEKAKAFIAEHGMPEQRFIKFLTPTTTGYGHTSNPVSQDEE